VTSGRGSDSECSTGGQPTWAELAKIALMGEDHIYVRHKTETWWPVGAELEISSTEYPMNGYCKTLEK
jgi:hypothetical protein